MARFREDDDENDAPVEKKRRRPKKKPVSDDDDGGGSSRPGMKSEAEGEDDGEENSLSTGNVLLDIILDFRDDCLGWAKEHLVLAIALTVFAVLLFLGTGFLTIRYVINYLNRPTWRQALVAYELGAYDEARKYAQSVLKYAPEDDSTSRAVALYVQGASTSLLAENTWDVDRRPYFLAAANYLREAEAYGFPPEQRADGYFQLGKNLYFSGELLACRPPLERALELGMEQNPENVKLVHWFLTNSWFLQGEPDLSAALRHLRVFQRSKGVSETERYEGYLLEALILLQMHEVEAAERVFLKVPLLEDYLTMRNFVSGQIAFLRARQYRRKAEEILNSRDPLQPDQAPVATYPAEPVDLPATPTSAEKSDEKPAETPPDKPMDDATLPSVLDPDTESLLPTLPDGAVWPVLPVFPVDTPPEPEEPRDPFPVVAVAPLPVERDDAGFSSSHRKIASLQGEDEIAPEEGSAPKDEAPLPPFDPDAILVLPTEAGDAAAPDAPPAPLPDDLPLPMPRESVDTDPLRQRARAALDQADAEYRKAIELFLRVRRDDTFIPRWLRTAELLEGICYEEMGDHAKAQQVFLHLSESHPGTPEAAAAEFLWAKIQRNLAQPESAFAAFDRAFETMRNEPGVFSPWVSRSEILDYCEEVVQDSLQAKDFTSALTLLHLLRGVMSGSRLARLRGESYEHWSESLARQAELSFGAVGEKIDRESKDKARRAGEAFDELARREFTSADYDVLLWRSAENYRRGRDYRRGIPQYKKYMQVNIKDHRPEVYYYLAEMYLQLDGLDEAEKNLKKALEDYPNHYTVSRMRLLLSRVLYEKKEWDRAAELLRQNLVGLYPPDSAIYRDSLYALGNLYDEQRKPDEAIPCLEEALQIHPEAVQAADAHYRLARAYLARAERVLASGPGEGSEEIRGILKSRADGDCRKALEHFQKTEELLVRRQNDLGLIDSERLMLRNVLFEIGPLHLQLGQYEQAVSVLNVTATRYRDRPEAVDALIRIAVAFRHLNQPGEAMAALNRAEVLLSRLKKNATIPETDTERDTKIRVQKDLIRWNEKI